MSEQFMEYVGFLQVAELVAAANERCGWKDTATEQFVEFGITNERRNRSYAPAGRCGQALRDFVTLRYPRRRQLHCRQPGNELIAGATRSGAPFVPDRGRATHRALPVCSGSGRRRLPAVLRILMPLP